MPVCVLHGGDMEAAHFPLESRNRLQRVAHTFPMKEVKMTKMIQFNCTYIWDAKINFTVGMDPLLILLVLFLLKICLQQLALEMPLSLTQILIAIVYIPLEEMEVKHRTG